MNFMETFLNMYLSIFKNVIIQYHALLQIISLKVESSPVMWNINYILLYLGMISLLVLTYNHDRKTSKIYHLIMKFILYFNLWAIGFMIYSICAYALFQAFYQAYTENITFSPFQRETFFIMTMICSSCMLVSLFLTGMRKITQVIPKLSEDILNKKFFS